MKDKLEEFIRENRQEFDIHDPDPLLWTRIIKEEKSRKPWYSYAWKAAAVILFGVLSVVVYEKFLPHQSREIVQTLAQIDPRVQELIEAEAYYTGKVNLKMEELKQYPVEYKQVKNDLFTDFAELDSNYKQLKNELKGNICNEEIIESMIQNYRFKLQILEQVLDQIKGSREGKTKKNHYEI
jgi:hypothetical protein